jgi:hypothetical protein
VAVPQARDELLSDDLRPRTKVSSITFEEYAERWVTRRELKPRTREQCHKLLYQRLRPPFGSTRLRWITSDQVEDWHYEQGDLDSHRIYG